MLRDNVARRVDGRAARRDTADLAIGPERGPNASVEGARFPRGIRQVPVVKAWSSTPVGAGFAAPTEPWDAGRMPLQGYAAAIFGAGKHSTTLGPRGEPLGAGRLPVPSQFAPPPSKATAMKNPPHICTAGSAPQTRAAN